MARAWIVTKGQYSSREIVAVFTTEAAAEAFCQPQWDYIDRAGQARSDWNWFDRYEIAEIPLNPVNEPDDTRLRFCISFNSSGDVTYTSVIEPDEEDREPVHGWNDGNVEVTLRADTLDQAIKAAAERRAQWLIDRQDDEMSLPVGISFPIADFAAAMERADTPSLLSRVAKMKPVDGDPTRRYWMVFDEEGTHDGWHVD